MGFSLNRVTPAELLETLRPSFLLLELRKGERTFRWAVPLWALKECLLLGFKLLRFAPYVVSQARLKQFRLDNFVGQSLTPAALEALFAQLPDTDLPRGEAYLTIKLHDMNLCLKQI